MRQPVMLSVLIPALGFSTELIQFESGKAAIARDVNENFMRLDTAIQNRAVKSVQEDVAASLKATDASLKATDAALKGVQATIGQIQTSKVDQSAMEKALGAKADTGTLADLARKHKSDLESVNTTLKGALTSGNLSGIRDTLKLKADTMTFGLFKRQTESALAGKQAGLGFAPLNSAGGTISGELSISKALTVGGAVSAGGFQTGGNVSALRGGFDTLAVAGGQFEMYPDGEHGAIYGDKSGPHGPGNYSVAWKRDGSATFLRTANQYLAIRAAADAPVFGDGKAERSLWHSGNLDPNGFQRVVGPIGLGAFTEMNPPVGSWSFDCHCGADPSAETPIASPNIQVFSMGNANRGMQLAGAYNSDSYFLRRGADAWTPWVSVVHSGNVNQFALAPTGGTITGDLRITGKLTTPPGATPADYVFEPDYKLAPLAEIEAFTKANKHLPEVPSAAEMTTQGVDVASMNMVLLKKVEELTLHAIAQQNESR